MKKIICIIILICVVFTFVICNGETSVVSTKDESSKNLLLRFLHDEVPIVNYSEEGDRKYYSDILDENISLEDSKFYIVDMDGDGTKEFGYYRYPMLDIIKYDKEDNSELWISVKSQQRRIGEGEMYAITTSQSIIYEYYQYDKDADLVESDYYRTGEEIDKYNETVYRDL